MNLMKAPSPLIERVSPSDSLFELNQEDSLISSHSDKSLIEWKRFLSKTT
jgi:hypothetical protein